jgi:cell shape-determining protein MreC
LGLFQVLSILLIILLTLSLVISFIALYIAIVYYWINSASTSLSNIYGKALNINKVGIKLLGPVELFNTLTAIYKYTSFKIFKPISF